MAAPTAPATADLVEGTGTRSFGAVTTSAGDWIVVEVEAQDDNTGTWPVTATGLTFTQQLDTGTGTGVRGRILDSTAPDAAGGSRTVTVTPSVGTRSYRARLTVVSGSRGPGNAAGVKTAQTISFTRSGYSSMLFVSVMDWSTGAVGSPTWTPGGATVASQQGVNATYVFGRWDNSGPTDTATTGDIGTVYTTPAVAVLEMLGSGDGPGGGDDGPQTVPMLLPVLSYDPLMQAVVYAMRPWQRRFQWVTQPWLNADDAVAVGGTSAPAEVASGTGTALDAQASVAPNAEAATGTGIAQDPTSSVGANAEAATGTGLASDAQAVITVSGDIAAGTGTAPDPTPAAGVNAEAALGTGAAFDATVSTANATSAPAEVASGTGTAPDPTVSLGVNAEAASGTGTAQDGLPAVGAQAGSASGTGTAQDPFVAIAVNAEAATGAGAALDAAVATAVNAP